MADEEVFGEVESLMRHWRLEEATSLLERRLSLPSPPSRIHHDLSVLYAQQGFFDEALREIETAMEHAPANRAVWHHYLALQKNNPVQPGDAQWKSMHLRFGDTLREGFDARHLAVARSKDPAARIRVGYLGPDTHDATARFVGPVLERFDRNAFEVVAYWNHERSLAGAQRFAGVANRCLAGLSTERIVELVLQDRIDILVDVAGHGAGNALPALAYRPAPVQATWLDYLATTGIETVDYRITDAVADPAGAEARHVEELLRLPVPQWCYRPTLDVPVGTARSDGPITFGSISVPLKLSARLLDLWARLLAGVPDARLRFLGIPEGRARERIVRAFEQAGIAAQRVEIRGRMPLGEFLSELASIDVVLDTFPFSGATATLDALWQGVPVVSLAGRLSHGRSGASILSALGRRDWVARDEDEYVSIASTLAAECAKGAADRARLRQAVAASPLRDEDGFARAMDNALRLAWSQRISRTRSLDEAGSHANSRADLLLASNDPESGRGAQLLDVLPAHRVTGQLFWAEFREGARAGNDAALARLPLREVADFWLLDESPDVAPEGSREWIALTTARHAAALRDSSLPEGSLAACDALAAIGSDALPHGSLAAAGRGHVAGLEAFAEGGAILALLWVGNRMSQCVVLGGPVLLVRRKLLDSLAFRAGPDLAASFAAHSFELHRRGARLGITASLAVAQPPTGDAARFRAESWLARETGTGDVPQQGVAASALKAIIPAASWPAFARRAEHFCDRF